MEEAGDLQKYFSDLDADFIGLKKVWRKENGNSVELFCISSDFLLF